MFIMNISKEPSRNILIDFLNEISLVKAISKNSREYAVKAIHAGTNSTTLS